MSSLREECGITGVIGIKEASRLIHLGLYALQHRGQESCGIISLENSSYYEHRAHGLVADAFSKTTLENLHGDTGVGHVRYATHGKLHSRNIQPFVLESQFVGPTAIAHNGNLTNAQLIKTELEKTGSVFTTTSDSEVFTHLIARSQQPTLIQRLQTSLPQTLGAYSLVIANPSGLYGVRDPFGFRPLVIGQLNDGWILASETCALDLIGASVYREVEPGEMVIIDQDGVQSLCPFPRRPRRAALAQRSRARPLLETAFCRRGETRRHGSGDFQ